MIKWIAGVVIFSMLGAHLFPHRQVFLVRSLFVLGLFEDMPPRTLLWFFLKHHLAQSVGSFRPFVSFEYRLDERQSCATAPSKSLATGSLPPFLSRLLAMSSILHTGVLLHQPWYW